MSQALSLEQDTTTGLSFDEWISLPEDEPGELVDGKLVEEEMPDYVHELLVALLIRLFGNWFLPLGGLVAGSDAKFAVAADRGRKPDVTVFLPGSQRPPRRGVIRVPPDIAVEIVSPQPRDGRRDRVEKPDEYAAFGIRYYWILDPELRSLEIFELRSDGRYARALAASSGTLDAIPGCPDLVLDLDELWARADELD